MTRAAGVSTYWCLLLVFLAIRCTCGAGAAGTEADDINTLELKTEDEVVMNAKPRQYPVGPFGGIGGMSGIAGLGGIGGASGGCPLCDSSVYSYCSYKVLHDSCCCEFPVIQLKPPQCYYSDCNLLYAKSCYEHMLIKNCCCNNPY